MEEISIALLVTLLVILVLGNPVTVLTVVYLSKRTDKYLMPALGGVLVNVVILTICIFSFGWWATGDEFFTNYMEGILAGITVVPAVLTLVASLVIALVHGLLLVGLVLMVIRERRLSQTMPSKVVIVVFAVCLGVWAVFESSLTDDLDANTTSLGEKIFFNYIAENQAESVEFQGYTVHLGSDYLYLGRGDEAIIQKFGDGFGEINEDFELFIRTGAKDMEKSLNYWCGLERYSCERSERDNYRFVRRIRYEQDGEEWGTSNMYYSPSCDVLLINWGENDPEGKYVDFVERFFSDNCS